LKFTSTILKLLQKLESGFGQLKFQLFE